MNNEQWCFYWESKYHFKFCNPLQYSEKCIECIMIEDWLSRTLPLSFTWSISPFSNLLCGPLFLDKGNVFKSNTLTTRVPGTVPVHKNQEFDTGAIASFPGFHCAIPLGWNLQPICLPWDRKSSTQCDRQLVQVMKNYGNSAEVRKRMFNSH